jgi:uncharacterized membrane protein
MSEIPPPTVPPATPPPPGGGSYSPPPPPPPGSANPDSNRTIMLVLSYLGILALVPLLVEKNDREVQWHAKNGLAIAIATIVIWIPVWILVRFIPFLGCLVAPIACIFPLIILVVAILGIMKALKGERLRIPVISDFADKM